MLKLVQVGELHIPEGTPVGGYSFVGKGKQTLSVFVEEENNMPNRHLALKIIAAELEANPESHAKIVSMMHDDPNYIPITVMLCVNAQQAQIRWRELYDKYAREMAKEVYAERKG